MLLRTTGAADHAGYVSHLRDDLGRQRDAGARVTPDPFNEPKRRLNVGDSLEQLGLPGRGDDRHVNEYGRVDPRIARASEPRRQAGAVEDRLGLEQRGAGVQLRAQPFDVRVSERDSRVASGKNEEGCLAAREAH